MPGKKTFIYALVDPLTHAVRYVGKANNPAQRLSSHLAGDGCNTWKDRWLGNLEACGMLPDLRILEECEYADWPERERWWIRQLRAFGEPLTNIAEGGDAPPVRKGVPKSPAHRKAVSDALKAAGIRPPSRLGMATPHTPEWNARISEAHKGRKLSPEHIAARRAAWDRMTTQDRSEHALKSWVTRRANAAKRANEEAGKR